MDMDWHTWGSQYSWNRTLVPDPEGWMSSLHSADNPLGYPLKYMVNLHPNGVSPAETHYDAFAKAMGGVPGSKTSYRCDLSNSTFASAYFDWMMGAAGAPAAPNNKMDYWWTDWGGCGSPAGKNVGSLWWANYLYHQDKSRIGNGNRGLVLSRYGGLGTHRYGVGFSGDAPQSYDTLAVQVQMTSQASNVLFGYWSHDIGGFHNGTVIPGFAKGYPYEGDEDPDNATQSELYLRWLQFGAFAPIFRTHCQEEPIPQGHVCSPRYNAHCLGCERRIWKFLHHFPLMKEAMVLRNGMGPYIYTHVREAFDSGVGLLRPMYYAYPEYDEAYATTATQYFFGNDMIIAPITTPANRPVNGTIAKAVWLPVGRWVSWLGNTTHKGPVAVSQTYSQSDIPVFVRAGAVIPLKTMASVTSPAPDPMMWLLYPSCGTNTGHV